MEFRHLRHFVAVAEELHFKRAADRIGMEQSAEDAKDAPPELLVRLLQSQ
ncbi:MAG: LysR family transcriptional regulator [Hyphomicrobium denitrificans]|nr:LysR family transcriptional regulator [Hyphomicrobium denitrificans]